MEMQERKKWKNTRICAVYCFWCKSFMLILTRIDDHITTLSLQLDICQEASGYKSHDMIHWGLVNFIGLTSYDHYNWNWIGLSKLSWQKVRALKMNNVNLFLVTSSRVLFQVCSFLLKREQEKWMIIKHCSLKFSSNTRENQLSDYFTRVLSLKKKRKEHTSILETVIWPASISLACQS